MSWSLEGVSAADLAASALAVAADVSVRGALLLTAAGLLAAVSRSAPARWRHALWATALAGVAALPVFAILDVGPAALARTGGSVELALAGAWAAGFAALTLRHAVASRRLRSQLVGSEPGPDVPGARVRIGGSLGSPVTFGFRPVVLLPPGFETWSGTSRRQVLLHEGAHVARRDWTTLRLTTALCHVLWFHPVVWIARRMLVLEAERAADETVLRSGERPSDYAQLLLDRASSHSLAPALAARRWLEIRVRSLLGPGPGSPLPAVVGLVILLSLPAFLSEVRATPQPPVAHCNVSAVALADEPSPEPEPVGGIDNDTQQAGPAFAAMARNLGRLSRPHLDAARRAASRLVRSCPFNRSAVGLPGLLSEALDPHFALLDRDELAKSPALLWRLSVLRDALDQQGRLLNDLGLYPLPEPKEGDYLADAVAWRSPPRPLAAGDLEAMLADAHRALDAIPGLVGAYDDETTIVINEAIATLSEATGGHWPSKSSLFAYWTTLLELAALAEAFSDRGPAERRPGTAALAAECKRLAELVERHLDMSC